MDFIHLLIVFIGGIVGGLYGSTVGGAALISFPLLILIGIPTTLALGTQRFAAIMLELASAARFHKAKKINLRLAITLGAIGAIGSIIGVNVVLHIDTKILNLIIGILLFIMALVMLNKDRLGIREHKITHKHLFFLSLCTIPLGFYTGFFGAGAGVFNSLILVFFGFSFMESAAIGRVIGLCTSLAGAFIFAQRGLINYPLGIALGLGFALGSWIGIGVALKKNEDYIKGLVLFVIVFSIIKLILNSFNIKII